MTPYWNSPHAWVNDRNKKGATALDMLHKVLPYVNETDLERLFRAEMEIDGYFEEHLEPHEVEVGLEVRVRKGCDLESWVGRTAFVCANVAGPLIGMPLLVLFADNAEYEIFDYTELRLP